MRKPLESAATSGRFLTTAELTSHLRWPLVSSLSKLGVELPGRQSLVTFFYIFKNLHLFVCACACVYVFTHSAIACMWRFKGSRRSWFPSTLTWVRGLKLMLSGFGGKHPYQLSQCIGPGDTCSSSFFSGSQSR